MKAKSVLPGLLILVAASLSGCLTGSDPAPPDVPDRIETKESARAAWEKAVSKNLRKNPSFAFVEDVPGLPRVLLIGDSISIGYTVPVRELLAGKVNVHRIPINGGDTRRGLESLDDWLGESPWDLVHFNFGLHDLKRLNEKGKLDASRSVQVPVDEYVSNLESLVKKLKAAGPKLIFASTTPVPEGAAGRLCGDDVHYNLVAKEVMMRHGVPVNDLHAAVFPRLDEFQQKENVHFTKEGSRFLGTVVAEAIENALNER